jgi:hypothetical protein
MSIALRSMVVNFVEEGHIEEARNWLSRSEMLPLQQDTYLLNSLCWFGSLWGYANQVLDICEQAVQLEPDNADILDSRGVARALTGDFDGAILDFQYFAINSDDISAVALRAGWILELEKGVNPFTAEVLESLK